jgi:hypothetical protein
MVRVEVVPVQYLICHDWVPFGSDGMDRFAWLALKCGVANSHVRAILVNNRDQVKPAETGEWVSPDHANVRGPRYYQ